MARTPEQNIARREKEAEAKRQKRAAAKAKAAPPRKPAAKKKAPVKAKAKRKPDPKLVAARAKSTAENRRARAATEARVAKASAPPQSKPEPQTAPVTISKGSPPVHTMARSYVRRSGAGQGKERHGTYQCTVSFTEPQMVQIRAASQLRNVSLAEMIRSAVVGHLNRGIQT